MSVVSRNLGAFNLNPQRRVYTAPNVVPTFENAPAPDYEVPPQLANYSVTAQKRRRPGMFPPANTRMGVPLKCDQEGSHAEGASLFNAPVNGPIAKLDTPMDIMRDQSIHGLTAESIQAGFQDYHKMTGVYGVPHTGQSLDGLVRGYRQVPLPLKVSDVSEPSANLYKPSQMAGKQYHAPFLQSQVGMDELRRR